MKKVKYKILFLFICINILFSFPVFADDSGDLNGIGFTLSDDGQTLNENKGNEIFNSDINSNNNNTLWNKIFKEYGILFSGIFGVATLTMVILFVFAFIKLGAAKDNPQERSQALKHLLTVGIATGLLGLVTVIVAYSSIVLK